MAKTVAHTSSSKRVSSLYRRAESIQSALLTLSEHASSVTELNNFFPIAHNVVAELMSVPNFFIVLYDEKSLKSRLVYFSDEFDNKAEMSVSSVLDYGLTGWVMRNGERLLCTPESRSQLIDSPHLVQTGKLSASWLGVPLLRNNKTIGAMVVQSYQADIVLSQHDADILQFISQHVVYAIERISQKETLDKAIRKKTLELEQANQALKTQIKQSQHYEKVQNALIEISELSCSCHDVNLFYQTVHKILAGLVYADNCYIALLSDDGLRLSFPYFIDQFKAQAPERPVGKGVSELVLKQRAVVLIDNTKLAKLIDNGELDFELNQLNRARAQGFCSWLGAPLIIDDEVKGVIAIQSYQHLQSYDDQDREIMRYVSNHIGLAIQRMLSEQALTRSNEHLEKMVTARTQALFNANQDLCQQIEERKKIEAQLYHDAHHDSLTGLPNRAMFTQKLNKTIENASYQTDLNYVVLFIDLDRFKIINDTFGHLTGDKFLIEVSVRLLTQLDTQDTLARIGGDEFVIILDSGKSELLAENIAQAIINDLARPFFIDGNELYAGSSIGLTSSVHNYKTSTEVLRDADAAMYQAKQMGRGCYVVFDESLHQALIDKLSLETELRKALKNKEIEFSFQAVKNLNDYSSLAFEALARWRHIVQGELATARFLSLAEETGVIFDIDMLALDKAFELLMLWSSQESLPYVSVNICGKIVHHPNQFKLLVEKVQKNAHLSSYLILELSEKTIKEDPFTLSAISQLRALNVKIALDDFGEGSGSMNLLYSALFDFVKIDSSIISKVVSSQLAQGLVKTVQKIGKQVGFITIAENVENQAQQMKLLDLGCQYGQGYHLQSIAQIDELIALDNRYLLSMARKFDM